VNGEGFQRDTFKKEAAPMTIFTASKFKLTLSAVSVAFVAIPSLALATPVIVTNGNFSAPGASPAGWTVSPGSDISAFTASAYQPCCGVTGTAADLSNRFASFGSDNEPNVSALSQVVNTQGTRLYRLRYNAGALGGGQQTLTANVYDSSNTLLSTFSRTYTANNALGLTFSPESLLFTANGASRISFNVDQFSTNVDGVLDNVSIVSGVPEASTWAMMMIGVGGIGAAARRRRRVAKLAHA
jgi:hypothetical protein